MTKQDDAVTGKNPRYERYRPKRHIPRIPISWWIRKKSYVYFILRELTSIFVAAYAVILLIQVGALSRGAQAWEALIEWFATPLSIGLHVIILIFVLYHSITWFNLAPTAMVLRIGKKRIPDAAILAVNFGMWALLSVGIAWLILAV